MRFSTLSGGVAILAIVLLAGTALVYFQASNADLHMELVGGYYSQPQFQVAQGQQLPEFQVAGTMQTGAPAPQGIPLSFQLPVPLPGPSPPAPTVITVGPRAKKAPVCKRCERQMRKIKVSSAVAILGPMRWSTNLPIYLVASRSYHILNLAISVMLSWLSAANG